jgi:phospholipid/cholesterol/gamma-HCH transport system substrate-binding protein
MDRLRRDRTLRMRAIGLAVATFLVLVTILGIARPNPFHQPQVVRAVFDESIGFARVDRDVRVGGVNVGRVGEIRRVGQDAEAELLLDEDIGGVFRDARASLRPHHPFEGTSFVDLDPGSRSAGPLGAALIPRSRTRVYVTLDQAARTLDENTRKAIKATLEELAPTLGPEAREGIGTLLDNAPVLTRQLRQGARAAQGPSGEELQGAVGGISRTVDALASRADQLETTIREADRTLAAVAVDGARPLDATLRELPPTLLEADRGSRALTALLGRVEPLAAELAPVMRKLRPTVRELRPFLIDTRPTLRRLRPVLADLRVTLERTSDAVPELLALKRAIAPVAEHLDEDTVPMLTRETRLGLPAYLQFNAAGSGLTDAFSMFETKEQNPIGTGHAIRLSGDVLTGVGGAGPQSCSSLAGGDEGLAERLEEAGLCAP